MTKKVDTWMPFLVDKYLGDTTHLTTEQHGAYCLLLLAMWKHDGELPNIDDQLHAITRLTASRWRIHKPLLMKFFHDDGECITQKRLSQELKRAKQSTNAKSEAGKGGSESRWGNVAESSAATRAQRLTAARARGTHTVDEWEALKDATGHKCVVCAIDDVNLVGGALTKDHILPIYQGGDDSIMNLQPMCKNCNSRKGNDCRDHRETANKLWRERLTECLAERLKNALQTPASIHTSSTSLRSVETLTPHTHSADSTAAGRVCGAMRRAGMADVQSGHPDLLALLEAGATEAEFVGAAAESVKREKGFAYAIGMLKRQRQDAAKASNGMHHGPMPGIPVNCDQVDATSGYLAEEAAHRTEVERQRLARIAAQQGGPA